MEKKLVRRGLAQITLVAVGLLGASVGEAAQSSAPSTNGLLAQVGQLVTPPAAGFVNAGNSLSNMVISGATVFAGAPLATITTQQQGAVFVYSQPAGGWSGQQQEIAELIASDPVSGDALGGTVSASGQTVVTGSPPTGPFTGRMFVFTEPPGGWSGTVYQAATLTAGNGTKLQASAISGSTILAEGSNAVSGTEASYVFTEPAGGWSGTIEPSATLTDGYSSSYLLDIEGGTVVAGGTISGPTVLAPPPDEAYVFTEPRTGWSGTLKPAATLIQSFQEPGAASVFTEPAGGWKGDVHQSAALTVDGDRPIDLAISGHTIAVAGPHDEGRGGCPCNGGVGLFSEPSRGWIGELTTTPSAHTTDTDGNGSIPLGVDGQTLFAGGQIAAGASTPDLDIFNLTRPIPESPPHPPSTAGATLTGLANGKPRLKFKLVAGTNAAPIQSITIALPTGLSFSSSHQRLLRGLPGLAVSADGKYTLAAKHNMLTLTLRNPQQQLSLTIEPPGIIGSDALVKSRREKLNIRLRVVDAAHRITTLSQGVR
jgi:hypothetical protein